MKSQLIFWFLFVTTQGYGQQKVVKLYPGKAPGSESWTWSEKSSETIAYNTKVVYDVVEPTLTVYPAQGTSTGTSVIIAPGGGFYGLSINSEGNEVAEWLSKKGVTAFVLKYRLVHSADPTREVMALFTAPPNTTPSSDPLPLWP